MPYTTEQQEYVKKIFLIVKKVEEATRTSKETPFNSTELRLLKELLYAKMQGEKLISTQLAKRLGVTRSSVSQMVQKLEKEQVVYREADGVDRKIAYVLLTKEAEKICKKELDAWMADLWQTVQTFGEEKMQTMLALFDEFVAVAEAQKKER